MKINTNVWSGSADVIYDIKRCASYRYQVENEHVKLNEPYDTSIFLFGNTNFINRTAIIPVMDSGENFYTVATPVEKNILIGLATIGDVYRTQPYNGNDLHSDHLMIAQSPYQAGGDSFFRNTNSNSSMINTITYNSLVLLIMIDATDGIFRQQTPFRFTNAWTGTLDDYIKNKRYETYPYITCCYCIPYYGSSTSRAATDRIGPVLRETWKIVKCEKVSSNNEYLSIPCTNSKYFMVHGFINKEYSPIVPNSFSDYNPYDEYRGAEWVANCGIFYGDIGKSKLFQPVNYNGENWKSYAFGLQYDENLHDYLIGQALKYGFIVTDNETSALSGNVASDPNIYVPSMTNGYVGNNWTSGTDNASQPSISWSNPWEQSGFDPSKPAGIDPNKYTDKIDLKKPALTTTGIFNRTFAMNSTNIQKLADFLWNADETIFNEIVKGLSLMGGNPIDGLIDLRLYPFDVSVKASSGISQNIVVGRTDTKVTGIKISDYNAVLELGSCTFFPYFGNFLDYEPFTTASLYIPYVGIVPISTADFMGQTISCKMVVDITTGSCTAIVFANDIPIIYKNGNIGVEIPMTGTNSAEYASRIAGGLTSGATDVTLGAASKSVGQVVSGVGAIADSALSVNNTMYNTAGSSSPACGLWQPQNCYFIIQRPVPIVPENYGHTVGYACNYQAKISECSGYTQTYNVDVSSINAPESEKNAIAEILNSGFYA